MFDQGLDIYIWIIGIQSFGQCGVYFKMADFECIFWLIYGFFFIQFFQRLVNDGVQDVYNKESIILLLLFSFFIILLINIYKI